MLMRSLGCSARGRPRGLSICCATVVPKISGNTSLAERALAKSAAVHCGFSSSAISGLGFLLICFHFPLVCLAKTDDMHLARPGREHRSMQPITDHPKCKLTALIAVFTGILLDHCARPFQLQNKRERQPARSATLRTLLAVSKLISTRINVLTKNRRGQTIYRQVSPAPARAELVASPLR